MGPQFIAYFKPLVETLKNAGGSGQTADIIDAVIERMGIPVEVVAETIGSGGSRVRNLIQWARLYLVKGGYMDSGQRGLWKLTKKGYDVELNDEEVYKIYKTVQITLTKKQDAPEITDDPDSEIEVVDDEAHGEVLLEILKSLSPGGFEKICKRVLTEVGIHDVEITGGSGDQGIDGFGVIKVNEVVGFNVIFQCKRYRESVSPHHVRDFRGTMQGRADKGIILTTGRFTVEARREAVRDGVPPIELIDGERLITLFEKFELGLRPKIVYDVIPDFFENFRD